MLRELRIDNLKSFRGPQVIPLAPLTLIYGSNSAGKSTLLQALLLLKQTIESSDPEQPELVVRGALADLGSFPGIIYAHDTSLTLRLGITTAYRGVRSGSILGAQPRRFNFSFKWDQSSDTVRQTGASLGLRDTDILTYTRRRGPDAAGSPEGLGQRQFPFRIGQQRARQVFVEWMIQLMATRSRMARRRFNQAELSELSNQLLAKGSFAAAPWSIMPVYPRLSFSSGKKTIPYRRVHPGETLEIFELYWRQANTQFRLDLASEFESIMYLGPLRRPPSRFHLISGARRVSVGREGEFLAEILNRRSNVLSDVNKWLGRLEIPYSLKASRVREADIGTAIGDVVVLVLTDQRSNLQVSPGDVGFGISQLLPIIVQTQIGRGDVILVEQPEIHVHPRLQAEVANLFVAATDYGNQLIVETHSEHIMLRTQNLVNKGELDPANVSVLYVDTDDEGVSTVVPLRLGSDGSFIDEWPHGFFEERFAEVFRG